MTLERRTPSIDSSQRKVESFDIAEHRVTRAVLEILIRRATYCGKVARGHIDAINSEPISDIFGSGAVQPCSRRSISRESVDSIRLSRRQNMRSRWLLPWQHCRSFKTPRLTL